MTAVAVPLEQCTNEVCDKVKIAYKNNVLSSGTEPLVA